MNITVEIDDKELNEEIFNILVRDAVHNIESEMFGDNRYSFLRRMYKENVQDSVRKLVKSRSEEIIEKAVHEASQIIARKALPKLIEKGI